MEKIENRGVKSVWKVRNGFTLVEVIISMSLLSIIAIAFLSLYVTSMFWTTRARDKTNTVAAAVGVVENAISGKTIVQDPANQSVEILMDVTNKEIIDRVQYAETTQSVSVTFRVGTSDAENVTVEMERIRVQKENDNTAGATLDSEIVIFK